MIKRFIVFAVCVLMTLPCSVMAAPDPPRIELTWTGDGGGSWASDYSSDDITSNGDGIYYLNGGYDNNCVEASWSLEFKTDPYVVAGVAAKNMLDVTQTFTLTVITYVSPPITTATEHSGDMAGSFSTDPTGGTLSTVSPDPLYHGLIDGVGVLPLYDDPSSWTRTGLGTTPVDLVSAGPLSSGPVSNDIAIQFKFSLTPEDVAAFTGTFEVVPEPGTICLLGIGALGLLRKRRA